MEVPPEVLDREGTMPRPPSPERMRKANSARVVGSLQLVSAGGFGGRSEFSAASQGVSDSPDMFATMRTRRRFYYLSPGVWGEPCPPQRRGEGCGLCRRAVRQGVRCGYLRRVNGGQLRGGLPPNVSAMPRRMGTHRSAWISQQPRQSAEFAPLQGMVRH